MGTPCSIRGGPASVPAGWGCRASLHRDLHAGHQHPPRTGSCRAPPAGTCLCTVLHPHPITPSPPPAPSAPRRVLPPGSLLLDPFNKGLSHSWPRGSYRGRGTIVPGVLPAPRCLRTPGTGRGTPRETNIKEHLLVLAAVGAARAPPALAQMLLWGARVGGGRGTSYEKSQGSEPSPPHPTAPGPPCAKGEQPGQGAGVSTI